MPPQSVKHASFLCSTNSGLRLAAFESALKVPDFVQTRKPLQPAPPSASNTYHPKEKRPGPVDGSADSDLSVKGLTAAELTIGPDHEELQEDSGGVINGEEDESEGVYFVQLGEEILQVGHMQKRKAQSQMEVIAKKRGPPTSSRCNSVRSSQQQEMPAFAGPSRLISLGLLNLAPSFPLRPGIWCDNLNG